MLCFAALPLVAKASDEILTTRRVLLGIDGSDGSSRAFDWFSRFSHLQHRDKVLLYHTVETPIFPTAREDELVTKTERNQFQLQVDQAWQRAAALEREFMAKCAQHGMACRWIAEPGTSPARNMVAAASQQQAHLLVVGSRGETGLRRSLLGGVSDYVVKHTDRPVIVVPGAQPLDS